MNNENINYVTGTIYSYSFLCMRKVWLSYHNLSFESESELVQIGKFIDENTYTNQKHNFMIDNKVNIDFLKDNIVHEIKKSDKEKQMAINQIKYYLFILKQRGFEDIKGELNIPSKRYKEEVLLEEDDNKNILERIELINKIIKSNDIPETINIRACKKCAYYEFCYI
ncbi:CRISPR-associated protein Cas4 [Brachyspira alvinipulli]|uniref:CRISPR-associated protein Cas4 n=1 Tax=Brachyspira alvinipulli TaxID=84379 RepID=UPI000486E31A|nr:CRISPR-associated protein Cas4 [Brachyspira alvinipulli]